MIMSKQNGSASWEKRASIDLERHEAKYIVHPSLLPAIREFIKPFAYPDPHAKGELPDYLVTTLQLDTHDYFLYRAREEEAINRFKLRVRTYGTDGVCPVFMEIKRKIRGTIVKSRATVPSALWCEDLVRRPRAHIPFKSPKEEINYLEFVRLVKELDARPILRIRYTRESYLGRFDNYARVTFDKNLLYKPGPSWQIIGAPGRWWRMDTETALNRDFSGCILELKTYNDAPRWMIDLVREFDLTRVGFCKYATAVRLESLFTGYQYSSTSEPCFG